MIRVTRSLLRETAEIEPRTRRPVVLQLVEGGRIVKVRLKGQRRWYTVTIKQIWHQGAANMAAQLKSEKIARRKARREAKQY